MRPYQERRKEAFVEIIVYCMKQRLDYFADELGGLGVNVGTRSIDQENGGKRFGYTQSIADDVRDLATDIAERHSLSCTVKEPKLEMQVGLYLSMIYFDEKTDS